MEQETKQEEKGAGFSRSVIEWLEDFVVMLGIFCLLLTFVVRQISVEGFSMMPNYHDGERVLITANPGKLVQGDVVVIVHAIEEGPVIKRVIATEGQKVDIDSDKGCVLIDDVPLDDRRFGIENGITRTYFHLNGVTIEELPIVVPEGHVFVLGDNRQDSKDSRFFGPVDKRNVLGKALWKFYPLSEFGPADKALKADG